MSGGRGCHSIYRFENRAGGQLRCAGRDGDEWVKCVRIYCLLQVMRGKRVLVVSMRPRYLQTLQEEFARVGSSGVCVWVREFYKDIVACILAREKSAEVYGNLDESSIRLMWMMEADMVAAIMKQVMG